MPIARIVRGSLAFGLAALSTLTLACSVEVKTQTKSRGQRQDRVATKDWKPGDVIEIENANGSVSVIRGTSTKVTATMIPFAFSDENDVANAQTAIDEVASRFLIEETELSEGRTRFYVRCDHASRSYGSAANGTTGCDDLQVQVPVGELTLSATTHNGSIDANGLTSAAGQQIIIQSDNGSASALNMTGSVKISTKNGNATGSVNPRQGSVVEVSTGNGDATLSLPSGFAADVLTLSANNGEVTVTDFPDLTPTSTSRGAAGTGAASIAVKTENGDVTLKRY